MDFDISYVFYLIGGFFLFGGLFLYPNERNEIQNKLDDLWRKAKIAQVSNFAKTIIFTRKVAMLSQYIFSKIFGPDIKKPKFIGITLCLSLIGFQIILLSGLIISISISSSTVVLGPSILLGILGKPTISILLLLGCVIYLVKDKGTGQWNKGVVIGGVILFFVVSPWQFLESDFNKDPLKEIQMTESEMDAKQALGKIVGVDNIDELMQFTDANKLSDTSKRLFKIIQIAIIVISDLLSLAITIWILKKLVSIRSVSAVFRIAFLDLFAALIILLCPFLVVALIAFLKMDEIFEFVTIVKSSALNAAVLQDWLLENSLLIHIVTILIETGIHNFTVLIPTAIIWIITLVVCLNLLLYPSILRPMYGLVESRALRFRKTFIALGSSFVFHGYKPEGKLEFIFGLIS